MARTLECSSTTTDDSTGEPSLAISGPLVVAVASLATAVAVAVAAGLLIEVPDRLVYEARLVARPGEVRLTAHRTDAIGMVHVSEGQRVSSGAAIVSLSTDALVAKRRRLADDAGRVAERLSAARLDLKSGVSADADEGPTTLAARRARIADLEGALWSINREMGTVETGIRHTTLRAPSAGRVTGVGSLAPGQRIETGATLAIIVPDRTAALVEIAVPIGTQDVDRRALAYPIAGRADPTLPMPARLVVDGLANSEEPTGGHLRAVRLEIEDGAGALTRFRQPGDVVAHIAFDAGTTKPIINLIMARFTKGRVIAGEP